MSDSTAVAIARRRRGCRAHCRESSAISARTSGTTTRGGTVGVGILGGGTTNAVVVMLTCACTVEGGATGGVTGEVTVQLASAGAPAQAKATAELNPPTPVTVTLKLSVWPSVTFCTDVGPVRPKSGAVALVPVPVNATVCGLPLALSVMVSVPMRVPVAVGVNVTLITQVFDPAVAGKVAGLIGHAPAPVLVSAKSPEAAIELIVRAAVPVFVSVTVIAALVVPCTWLPNVKLVGASPTPGAVPVPVNGAVCVPEPALSVTVSVPARAPKAVGVNVTLMVQVFDPAVAGKVAGLIGQAVAPVLVAAKSPEAAIELIVRAPVPLFVSVTVIAALVVFSN